MRYHLGILSLFLIFGLTHCGHYRSTSGGWRGPGAYKYSSDYEQPEDPQLSTDSQQARKMIQPGMRHQPRNPFALRWPVQRVKINRGYRPSKDPRHDGLDLGGRRGDPILAAHEGVVIYTGRHFKGYGNMVMIEYSPQWATLYAHLDRILVKEGQIVSAGELIGRMGSTGRTTGVHLHFELISNRLPVDPLKYLSLPTQYTSEARR